MKPFERFYRLWREVLPTQCFALGHRVSGCVSSRSVWPPPPNVWSGILVPVALQQHSRGSGRESRSEILQKFNALIESTRGVWYGWLQVEADDDFFTSTKRCSDGEDDPPPSPVSAPGCRIRVHEK